MTDPEPSQVLEGFLEPGAPDWVYVPFGVPAGVTELDVSYRYDRPETPDGVPGNRLDIGVFDARGHELGNAAGFRGWSGGARTSFRISASAATPGYLPGPIVAGTWHVVLGPYTVAPDGLAYRIEIRLRYGADPIPFRPLAAPHRATGRGRAWYRGDLHTHTVHSDGRWEPAELVTAAREAGLDFFVSTEHNTSSAAGIWGYHAPDDLLIIDGEEVTTRNGHFVAAGLPAGTWIDWRYRAADGHHPRFVAQIARHGAVAIAAHPFCPFVGCSHKFGFEWFDAVEVWNGPWTPDDEAALLSWDATLAHRGDRGWLPAVAGSDTHHREQTMGLGHTVVLAEDLTRAAILAGVRAGAAYLAESAAVTVGFTLSGNGQVAGIGDRLNLPADSDVRAELEVRGAPGTIASFVTDQGTVASHQLGDDDRLTWATRARAATYVRAEVRRPSAVPGLPGPMVALTNPIFLRPAR